MGRGPISIQAYFPSRANWWEKEEEGPPSTRVCYLPLLIGALLSHVISCQETTCCCLSFQFCRAGRKTASEGSLDHRATPAQFLRESSHQLLHSATRSRLGASAQTAPSPDFLFPTSGFWQTPPRPLSLLLCLIRASPGSNTPKERAEYRACSGTVGSRAAVCSRVGVTFLWASVSPEKSLMGI